MNFARRSIRYLAAFLAVYSLMVAPMLAILFSIYPWDGGQGNVPNPVAFAVIGWSWLAIIVSTIAAYRAVEALR